MTGLLCRSWLVVDFVMATCGSATELEQPAVNYQASKVIFFKLMGQFIILSKYGGYNLACRLASPMSYAIN